MPPIVVAAIAIAGTAVSIYGQKQSADAAKATAKYNADMQRSQALQETAVAAENARRKTRESARVIGEQRAALAQSGLAMEGTPLAILGESATTLQRDVLDIGYEASNKARSLIAGADMSLWTGKQQAKAANIEMVGTGLKGIGGAISGYGQAAGLFAPKATTGQG